MQLLRKQSKMLKKGFIKKSKMLQKESKMLKNAQASKPI
jgi:hypothetical protein